MRNKRRKFVVDGNSRKPGCYDFLNAQATVSLDKVKALLFFQRVLSN